MKFKNIFKKLETSRDGANAQIRTSEQITIKKGAKIDG